MTKVDFLYIIAVHTYLLKSIHSRKQYDIFNKVDDYFTVNCDTDQLLPSPKKLSSEHAPGHNLYNISTYNDVMLK